MALPTLSKNWEFSVNIAAASSTDDETDCDETILAMKDALTDGVTFTVPWTVALSSDGTTTDASDLWADIGDIVHAAAPTAHSWIVLEAPSGFQLCFDTGFTNSLPERWGVYYSPSGGFSGGSTTARPTASDEVELSSSTTAIFPTTTFDSKVHCIMSDDGEETRLFVMVGGVTLLALITSELASADIPDPTFIHFASVGAGEMLGTSGLWNNGVTRIVDGAAAVEARYTAECIMTSSSLSTFRAFASYTVANPWTSEFHIAPVGVGGPIGTSQQGKVGNVPDLWWGQQVNNTGDQYPAPPDTPLQQFTQFGVFVVPWNGTVAQVT